MRRSTDTSVRKHHKGQLPMERSAAADRTLFTQIAAALHEAAMTDEPHRHSGESDRLLRIASDVSLRAARAAASCDLENAAYDVAACINAARLVPGDAESAQRSTLLAQAALQEQMEQAGEHVPASAGTPAQWRELARQANHEIQQLAQALIRIDETQVEQEHIVVHGMVARIGLLLEIIFLASALHGESRESWGTPAIDELRRIFHGGIGPLE